jgi:dipeptidyl aminopeptidase/acylaminoacyl peptidase
VPTDGSEPPFRLTKTKTAETSPQLSPDGSKIAYLRGGQLLVQDLGNGQLWQVTDVEGESNSLLAYRWSPDGRRFIYMVRKGSSRKMVLPNYSGRFVKARTFPRTVAGDKPTEFALYVVPVKGGKPNELDLGSWNGKVYATLPEWSPDSNLLLLRSIHPDMKKGQIRVIDAKTGNSKALHEETDQKWAAWPSAGWSPDSRFVFFTSDQDGWSHLYKVAADGGEPQQVTHGPWEIHTETFSYDPQWVGDHLYYTSTEGGPSERHFYRITPDGSGKETLSKREGLNIGLVSEDGRHTAWMLADLKNPFDLYVDDNRVTRSLRPEFYEHWWPETRFVSFPSRRDGKSVAAKLLLPPGYDPDETTGKLWPAVFFIHGAGYATSVLKQWGSYNVLRFAFNCYLAQQGYVILDLDYRGSSGYGRDWRTDVYLHLGGSDLDDVLGGVDYLSKLGNIDGKRIGIWCVSYGGFMTNMAMFLAPDTFCAGASWAAVNDWENYNAYYTAQRLMRPDENPEAYRRSSPIHFSGLLRNPLLIVHGMVDGNVLFQDAVQLTEKLIQEGKDFSHIYYPEESHGFVRDETLIDAFRRTAEWLDQHLQ